MHRRTDEMSPWFNRFKGDRVIDLKLEDLTNPYNRYILLMSDQSSLIEWLQINHLIKDSVVCDKCQQPCKLTSRSRTIDQYNWRCVNRHERSLRSNSIFDNSHLHLQDILNFVFNYAERNSLFQCSQYSGMDYKKTAVNWGRSIREMFCSVFVQQIHPVKFTGIVEIDESLFGRHTKNHRGQPRGHQIWIFGLVERESNRLKLFPVDNRCATTLIGIIKDNVEPGSTIYSDGWRAYSCLNTLGYKHYVVQHKYAFKALYKDETTGHTIEVHTNRIEGAWKHAKEHFQRINGTSIRNFEGHLCEIMYRNWMREPPLPSIIKTIVECYSLDKPYQPVSNVIFQTWFMDSQPSQNDTVTRIESIDAVADEDEHEYLAAIVSSPLQESVDSESDSSPVTPEGEEIPATSDSTNVTHTDQPSQNTGNLCQCLLFFTGASNESRSYFNRMKHYKRFSCN
jgi:transposase-like protein